MLAFSEYRARLNYVLTKSLSVNEAENNNNDTQQAALAVQKPIHDSDMQKHVIEAQRNSSCKVEGRKIENTIDTTTAAEILCLANAGNLSLVTTSCNDSSVQNLHSSNISNDFSTDQYLMHDVAAKNNESSCSNKNITSTIPAYDNNVSQTDIPKPSDTNATTVASVAGTELINKAEQNISDAASAAASAAASVAASAAASVAASAAAAVAAVAANSPVSQTSTTNSSSCSSSTSTCSDTFTETDEDKDAMNECYYLAGIYDVVSKVIKMEPGVE